MAVVKKEMLLKFFVFVPIRSCKINKKMPGNKAADFFPTDRDTVIFTVSDINIITKEFIPFRALYTCSQMRRFFFCFFFNYLFFQLCQFGELGSFSSHAASDNGHVFCVNVRLVSHVFFAKN